MPHHAPLSYGKRGMVVSRAEVMKKIFAKNDIPDVARELLERVLASRANGAAVIALSGDLGAGKTTLSQAIARELGVRENVISPTFVIMKKYITEGIRGVSRLVHIDAYRLDSTSEIEKIGWAELVADPENLILIEWPEKVPEAIPAHAYRVALSHENEEERGIDYSID